MRKQALSLDDLNIVISHFQLNPSHDDLLFVSMLLTGFFALMRLGKLAFPDNHHLRNWQKVSRRSTISFNNIQYLFHLPCHKANRFFEGSIIIVRKMQYCHDPLHYFCAYISSHDCLFPYASPLWLTSSASVPTRVFFTRCLHLFFDHSVARQFMRAGGATSLAKHGVSPVLIQAMGWWSSEAFKIYVRKHPVVLHSLLFGAVHD